MKRREVSLHTLSLPPQTYCLTNRFHRRLSSCLPQDWHHKLMNIYRFMAIISCRLSSALYSVSYRIIKFVHSTWTEQNCSELNSSSEHVYSNASFHVARRWLSTNCPSFAAANRIAWRWRAWPMNASCNWVDLLQVISVQFTCYGRAFIVSCGRLSWLMSAFERTLK